MARDLDTATAAALAADAVRLAIFFEGEFATGTVRLWSGVGDFTWNDQVWQGVGTFGGVSPVQETQEVRANGVNVTLSGIPSELVSLALGSLRQNRPGKLWLGFLPVNGAEYLLTEAGERLLTEAGEPIVLTGEYDLLGEPILLFDGRLDVGGLDDGGETGTISLAYESRLIDLERPRVRRYTHEDQLIDYPGDLGFEYVPALQDATITWGRG